MEASIPIIAKRIRIMKNRRIKSDSLDLLNYLGQRFKETFHGQIGGFARIVSIWNKFFAKIEHYETSSAHLRIVLQASVTISNDSSTLGVIKCLTRAWWIVPSASTCPPIKSKHKINYIRTHVHSFYHSNMIQQTMNVALEFWYVRKVAIAAVGDMLYFSKQRKNKIFIQFDSTAFHSNYAPSATFVSFTHVSWINRAGASKCSGISSAWNQTKCEFDFDDNIFLPEFNALTANALPTKYNINPTTRFIFFLFTSFRWLWDSDYCPNELLTDSANSRHWQSSMSDFACIYIVCRFHGYAERSRNSILPSHRFKSIPVK